MKTYEMNVSQILELVPIQPIKKVDLVVHPVRKAAGDTILNSIANALSSSIANGNETVQIILRFYNEEQSFDLKMHDDLVVRNNMDYHEIVSKSRALKNEIDKIIKK